MLSISRLRHGGLTRRTPRSEKSSDVVELIGKRDSPPAKPRGPIPAPPPPPSKHMPTHFPLASPADREPLRATGKTGRGRVCHGVRERRGLGAQPSRSPLLAGWRRARPLLSVFALAVRWDLPSRGGRDARVMPYGGHQPRAAAEPRKCGSCLRNRTFHFISF